MHTTTSICSLSADDRFFEGKSDTGGIALVDILAVHAGASSLATMNLLLAKDIICDS
jgi:hypothetical protein